MTLPFTEAQFLDVFQQYNTTLFYGVGILWLVSAAAAVAWFARGRVADKWIVALLAGHWLWAGIIYHLLFFTRINPAAYIFGILFLVQAALLAWHGLVRSRLHFRTGSRIWRVLGAMLVVYSILYPFLGLAVGLEYPRLPTFGVPCPTTLLTVGFLLSTSPAAPRSALVIPLLWSVIAGSSAFLLHIYTDFLLLVAAILLLAHLLIHRSPEAAH